MAVPTLWEWGGVQTTRSTTEGAPFSFCGQATRQPRRKWALNHPELNTVRLLTPFLRARSSDLRLRLPLSLNLGSPFRRKLVRFSTAVSLQDASGFQIRFLPCVQE
jgi:hypothetical protein